MTVDGSSQVGATRAQVEPDFAQEPLGLGEGCIHFGVILLGASGEQAQLALLVFLPSGAAPRICAVTRSNSS